MGNRLLFRLLLQLSHVLVVERPLLGLMVLVVVIHCHSSRLSSRLACRQRILPPSRLLPMPTSAPTPWPSCSRAWPPWTYVSRSECLYFSVCLYVCISEFLISYRQTDGILQSTLTLRTVYTLARLLFSWLNQSLFAGSSPGLFPLSDLCPITFLFVAMFLLQSRWPILRPFFGYHGHVHHLPLSAFLLALYGYFLCSSHTSLTSFPPSFISRMVLCGCLSFPRVCLLVVCVQLTPV